jgi:general secretion pathway protein C
MVIWVASALAALTWTVAGSPPRRVALAERQIVTSAVSVAPVNMDAILAFAPFGTPAPAGPNGAAGAIANTNFILQGILLAADPAASQAIITTQGGRARAYLAGETLPGGAVLVRIETTQITLRIAGREETLTFPVQNRPAENIAARVLGQGAASVTRNPTPIDEVIVNARQRIVENPKALLDELGVKAGTGGYEIGPAASQMTLRAGFKPGDIVTSVNGVAVGDIESDRRLFEDVVASGSARVEILRAGKITVLTFPLR